MTKIQKSCLLSFSSRGILFKLDSRGLGKTEDFHTYMSFYWHMYFLMLFSHYNFFWLFVQAKMFINTYWVKLKSQHIYYEQIFIFYNIIIIIIIEK